MPARIPLFAFAVIITLGLGAALIGVGDYRTVFWVALSGAFSLFMLWMSLPVPGPRALEEKKIPPAKPARPSELRPAHQH
jgi:predicted MFS family arabinose efflux permease